MSQIPPSDAPDLPITDFFEPSPLHGHGDFSTQVGLQLQSTGAVSDAARSWLGGMPEMLASEPWPEGPSGKMAFIAQICCADLPPTLWGGIGPRDGWLLIFLDALPVGGEPYSRILHVLDRGAPRHEGSEIELSFVEGRNRPSPAAGPVFPAVPIQLVVLPQREGGMPQSDTVRHKMGGLPTVGWEDPDHMTVSAYAPLALRQAWAEEYDYLGMDPTDEQEVLLFELATDEAAGWMWGDMGTALIRMPRGDLASGRFDRACLEIADGG